MRVLPLTLILFSLAAALHLQNQTNRVAIAQPDLSTISHIAPKGRVQDREYNRLPIVDELLGLGTQSIPYLISKLLDETKIDRPVLDYWNQIAVGDVALIILTNFFTDSSLQKTTIPGVGWDEFLKRTSENVTGEQLLRDYIDKYGRKTIQARWNAIWARYRYSIMWDAKERCFRLCPSVSVSCPSQAEASVTFVATVDGVDAGQPIEYVWTLTKGKITNGQGSKTIVVEVPDRDVLTATVEVLGFPTGCGNKASCSLNIH